MNKLILIFLVVILIASFALSAMAFELLEWGELWKTFSEDEKMIMLLGTFSGNIMTIVLLSEKSASIQDIEIGKFVMEFTISYVEYASHYEKEEKGYEMIRAIDRFYTSPDNTYCNPASLAYLSWLESEGKDITKSLERLRVYSEFGS